MVSHGAWERMLLKKQRMMDQMLKEILAINLSLRGGDYARVGRALALYEVGDKEEAFAEMEDVSISLKGYPGETFCLWQGFLFNSHFKTFSTLCWDKVRCSDKQEVSLSAFAFLFSKLV
ncbi:hypothetical protein ES319_D11G291400v1 [Gossypium barbadense]|uniref:Uncharacterized protein n=1 Tax=Gossypium barbadense TaxID=3634 RepID=A0A5J5PIL2_GOSBA|nr:hypothetical protein ES319_D11G291400v1 [Gossypium barbadense]